MISLLDRLIWAEIASSFGLGWGIFVALLVVNHLLYVARLAIERGVRVETAALLLLDKFPWLIAHTVPAGVLLGTMLGLGRLADRNEITALRACGVSLHRLAVPVVLAGAAATVGALAFAESVGSAGEHQYHETLAAILRQTLPPHRDGHTFVTLPTPGGTTFLYAQHSSPTLSDVTTVTLAPGAPLKLIQSSAAGYDHSGRWTFKHGHLYVMEAGRPLVAGFEALTIDTSNTQQIAEPPILPDEMSLRELAATARTLERQRLDPWLYAEELHFRLAEQASSIAFALVAIPLRVGGHNAGSEVSIGLTILLLFVYYFLTIPARLACDVRLLAPVLAAWLPNVLIATTGMVLLVARRGSQLPTRTRSRSGDRRERGHRVIDPVIG